ncbi:glycosyltransferase family 39 protein [Mycolicibacterium sp. HK-90]|uniref:ArnT family glycosyltransferase n=1 Tax=Mycolicibacterium sp. HK-90 TaxID=3056937 RepID=UPI00265A648D|nr:glycosyltransferase family 39 protein [Mycolicibacterium sp. HK-90]WKG06045.1 glycosyltransferase family 39 protein [Mycolicibacterium sp. HK-90]
MTTTLDAAPARKFSEVSWITRERSALSALLFATTLAYLWHITRNGMANQFYAAAAQAGSMNWEALLFGSLDPANFITVDKPPLSQWVMGLSGQLFGFSSAGMLIPEAMMGVGSVWLLYSTVRRVSGPAAGLLAGAALALTPVAALMFRFNNPDAVMVLLMTAAAYCTVRAVPRRDARWLVFAGVALGFAFLAKMLEGLMVMPAIGLVYLVAATVPLRRRLLYLLWALAAFVLSAGWFVVLTLVWPASSRPYLAGSTDDNFMNLVLGYNGFGRVLGHGHGPAGTSGPVAGHPGGFGGQGMTRLFTGEFGFENGWLLPAAVLATGLVLVSARRRPRTDLTRAGAILFGSWLLIDGLVLSVMRSSVHPYYCLSLAPAVAALFGIGVTEAWLGRESRFHRIGLAAMLLVTAGWSWWILGRNPHWLPPLRWVIAAVAVATVAALLWALHRADRPRLAISAVALAVTAGLAGPAAYTLATIGQPHGGGSPTVGPPGAGGGYGGRRTLSDNRQLAEMLRTTDTTWSAAVDRSSAAAGLELSSHTAVMAIGGFTGTDPVPTLAEFQDAVTRGLVTYYLKPRVITSHGHWFVGRAHTEIASWVSRNFAPIQVGSDIAYDLRAPLRS